MTAGECLVSTNLVQADCKTVPIGITEFDICTGCVHKLDARSPVIASSIVPNKRKHCANVNVVDWQRTKWRGLGGLPAGSRETSGLLVDTICKCQVIPTNIYTHRRLIVPT